MNITLSASPELIERAREYARRHGMSLNQMVRDYLARACAGPEAEEAAAEFARLARDHAGCSDGGPPLRRDALHERGREGALSS